mmetsp:Transcript_13591/g.18603  ORF Transcript_13591/g.18603 Transcript_13591/m.18603 type:complete len:83 (-) Transcript_13591:529-777(-)|eukprot:CAMPEP_0185616482 /NCGR_PEP_ID=MMETSP0436-20130131/39899_1 /TAXON_ID=626734 ORGANISM="Favella taraikaensis, Strain Fe Narragansett Bay" /NCGR_SAMPLE_ID=MMETSP0436 /ASSEMBLY_ACC=CAM_ASM_000390 /LENGTH=82 /DNA_ID=CAMNT_0028253181 /DNA_START=471 /DNA_END=719 /DNA_ORIENTATION=+
MAFREKNLDSQDEQVVAASSPHSEPPCEQPEKTTDEEVSYGRLLRETRFTMAVLACAWSNISFCFMEPILSMRLQDFELTAF